MKPRNPRKPNKSRKSRKSRKPWKLGEVSFYSFSLIINKSVASSLRDICTRGMQPVKHLADICNYYVAWRAAGLQFKQSCIMQQLIDVASARFGSDYNVVQAYVQRIVVCMQFACIDLARSFPNCADLVFESLRDWA